MAAKALPSQGVLRQLLDYDPEAGALSWKKRDEAFFQDGRHAAKHTCAKWNARFAGKIAFTASTKGYRCGAIFGDNYLAHRVIWRMTYGTEPDHIDHINGDRRDNRLENLRDVGATENARNSCIPSHNTSGMVGLSFDNERGKWAAYITLADRKKHLGRFSCLGQAIRARKEAETLHGFHENHGRAA